MLDSNSTVMKISQTSYTNVADFLLKKSQIKKLDSSELQNKSITPLRIASIVEAKILEVLRELTMTW